MDIVKWEVMVRRILALPKSENAVKTHVTASASPYPKYPTDKVVRHGGYLPTGFDSVKIPFEIAMIDERNPNQNKRLGRWFTLAWIEICIIRGEMFDWPEILDEILDLATELKQSWLKVKGWS